MLALEISLNDMHAYSGMVAGQDKFLPVLAEVREDVGLVLRYQGALTSLSSWTITIKTSMTC